MSSNQQRRSLIKTELDESGFYFFGSDTLDELLLQEIEHVISVPVHEGRRPRYGCIMVSDREGLVLAHEPKDVSPSLPLEIARPLADGCFSFVLRTPKTAQLVRLSRSFADEYGLFGVRDDFLRAFPINAIPPWDMGIVQRSESGVIRVMGPRNIAIRKHESWTKKEYKYAYMQGIDISCRLHPEESFILRELISLAVHGLSAQGVGCTIVYKRTEGKFDSIEPLGEYAISDVEYMRVDDSRWHNAIIELLAQKDGAVLVQKNGTIEMIGARLKDCNIQEMLPSRGGTRHSSAKRYSAAYPDCIVLVISSDGPVTIYSSGVKVEPRDPLEEPFKLEARIDCPKCGLIHITANNGLIKYDGSCKRCGSSLPINGESLNREIRIISRIDGGGCYSSA